MEIEEAITIIANTISNLRQLQPRGTGIRAKGVKGLVVENCRFIGLERALDISESQDISWKRNIINNYQKYSELLSLLEQFLAETTKKEPQVNKGVLRKINDSVLKRWPELAGKTLVIAIERIIASFN